MGEIYKNDWILHIPPTIIKSKNDLIVRQTSAARILLPHSCVWEEGLTWKGVHSAPGFWCWNNIRGIFSKYIEDHPISYKNSSWFLLPFLLNCHFTCHFLTRFDSSQPSNITWSRSCIVHDHVNFSLACGKGLQQMKGFRPSASLPQSSKTAVVKYSRFQVLGQKSSSVSGIQPRNLKCWWRVILNILDATKCNKQS